MYSPDRHNHTFLEDLMTFTHIFLEHLESFSKGKILTIKTAKMRKIKKKNKKNQKKATQRREESIDEDGGNESANGAEFDPRKPDELSQSDDEEEVVS